jgi:hypothetical protein
MPRPNRICGFAVTVQKTFDEYTISGTDARGLRDDFIDRGFKPGPYQPDLRGFTIAENDIVGSFEATRIKSKLNYLARENEVGV